MTTEAKKQALINALNTFKFPERYTIVISQTPKKRFAIGQATSDGLCINAITSFMTYEELNTYLLGYHRALTQPYK